MKIKLCAAICLAATACRAAEPLPGTFTTNMVIRYMSHSGGERGFLVQGPLNDTEGKADLVRFSRGNQISGNWYDHFDSNQGWILFWFRPEWNGNDGRERRLLQWSENGFLGKNTANELVFSTAAGVSVSTNISGWTAGRTYRIEAFWDAYNTVDGPHRLGLGVNQTNIFGMSSPYAPEPPAEYIHVGSSLQTNRAANGIIGTLNIFRRYDTNAVFSFQTGSGHNIASWDAAFAIPTARGVVVGPFLSGITHAYTHPYTNTSLLPGNNRMGGYMLAGNYAADGWSLEGAPSVAAMAAGQKIFRGGYQATSSGANQGMYQDIPVTAGTNLVMRALAHSDGTAIPRAIFHNQTAGSVIGQLTGRAGSTRLDPDILIFTCQAPAGCATIRVKLVNTQSSGTVYWHQCETMENKIRNPSVETGAMHPTNNVWVPTQWTCSYSNPPNIAVQETVHVHSGSSAIRVDGGNNAFRSYTAYAPSLTTFNSVGWFGCSVPVAGVTNTAYHSDCGTAWWEVGYSGPLWKVDPASNYVHHAFIGIYRAYYAIMRTSVSSGRCFTDDVYAFPLPNRAITVAPALQAESIEGYHGTRVDGYDRFIGPYPGLDASSGALRWHYVPRHSASCMTDFGHPTVIEFGKTNAHAYIATLWGDADNHIKIYWAGNDLLRLRYRMSGTDGVADWTETGIEAGRGCRMQLTYTGGGDMSLRVQQHEKPAPLPVINMSGIPAAFAVAPSNVCWGANWNGSAATFQGDAAFGPWPPGTVVRFY